MIVWYQMLDRKLLSYLNIANESEPWGLGDLGEAVLAILEQALTMAVDMTDPANLDFWMIRRNPKPYQSERDWQLLIHVNQDVVDQRQQSPSRIKPCWPRSNDGHTRRWHTRAHSIVAKGPGWRAAKSRGTETRAWRPKRRRDGSSLPATLHAPRH